MIAFLFVARGHLDEGRRDVFFFSWGSASRANHSAAATSGEHFPENVTSRYSKGTYKNERDQTGQLVQTAKQSARLGASRAGRHWRWRAGAETGEVKGVLSGFWVLAAGETITRMKDLVS
jgi:hypothetical protein